LKQLASLILFCFVLFCLPFSGHGQSPAHYRNPVIPGDFPDPTVIRVGKMYYAAGTTSDFEYIGRQGMLDEVIWDKETGWPRFKNGNTPSVRAEMPFAKTRQLRDTVYYDDFSTDKNLKFWQWDLTQTKPEIKIKKKILTISSAQDGVVFAGINPKTGNYSFEAKLAQRTGDLSGICVYGNSKNLLAFTANQNKLVLFQLKKGTKEILAEITIPENAKVSLKLEALHGRVYKFFYSTYQKNWIQIKIKDEFTIDGNFLPQWGVGIRTGLMFDGNKDRQGSYSSVKINYSFS